MGVSNSLDIYQNNTNELLKLSIYIRACIDYLLIFTTSYWDYNLVKMEQLSINPKGFKLKCNIEKIFDQAEMEYLSFWITRKAVWPVSKKIKYTVNMDPMKDKWGVKKIIIMIKYYEEI